MFVNESVVKVSVLKGDLAVLVVGADEYETLAIVTEVLRSTAPDHSRQNHYEQVK
jgi:hypothetical protein